MSFWLESSKRLFQQDMICVIRMPTVISSCFLLTAFVVVVAVRDAQFDIFRVFDTDPLMCALDSPRSSSAGESQLSCANMCQHDGDCTAFNYRNSSAECEMFDSLPCNYSQVQGCVHYQKHRQPILVQRNVQGKYTFDRKWTAYKAGFSNSTTGDFWLGNDAIHNLTYNNEYKVRFEVQAKINRRWYWAEYCTFAVTDETTEYQLHVDQYTGTAGDPLSSTAGSFTAADGMKFTTWDNDNDLSTLSNCARYSDNVGGFWYRTCSDAFINVDDSSGTTKGLTWKPLPGVAGGWFGNLLETRVILLQKRV